MPKRFVLRTWKAARLRQQAPLQFARSAALQPDRTSNERSITYDLSHAR